jgi:hypothetical protein
MTTESDDDGNRAVVVPVIQQQRLWLPLPRICLPLPAGSPGYTVLPQHIVLYIFEFEEKELTKFNTADFFCRFRAQYNERQFHAQYRSIMMNSSEFFFLMERKGHVLSAILSRTRYMRLNWTSCITDVLPHLTEALLLQLCKVYIDTNWT